MDIESQRERQLRHIQEQRERLNRQLDRQQERINAQFNRRRERMQQRLSQKKEEIINGALELLNEEGINELSLRKLARKLNIQAPAIYWYFESKENLIDHMAEEILARRFTDLQPCEPGADWKEWFLTTCTTLRSAMLEHRDGARVVAGAHLYPAVTLLDIFETSLKSLTDNGVPLQTARVLTGTAIHFTFGNAIEVQSSPTKEQVEELKVREFLKDYPLFAQAQKTQPLKEKAYDWYEDAIKIIMNGYQSS